MKLCSHCGARYADTIGSDCPVCHGEVGTTPPRVFDFMKALLRREREEEQRLERKVIERWTGKDGERDGKG